MPKKLSLSDFIEKSNKVHNYKYDYSKSVYVNSITKLIIICPIHNIEFLMMPTVHYHDKCGCSLCDPTNTSTTEIFIEKVNKIHNYKYDYSKVNYVKNNIDVEIICSIHGSFFQIPAAHLKKQGCPHCANNQKSNTTEFIEKARKIHGDKYDYSLVEYTNKTKKVKIICLKHNAIFEQKAYVHLSGHGCKICRNSKLELYLRDKLINNNIEFLPDFRFDNCRNVLPLPFDFYLINLNILFECDGIQHFKPLKFFGGEKRFEYQKLNDNIKTNYCLENNIKLIRVSNIEEIDNLINTL